MTLSFLFVVVYRHDAITNITVFRRQLSPPFLYIIQATKTDKITHHFQFICDVRISILLRLYLYPLYISYYFCTYYNYCICHPFDETNSSFNFVQSAKIRTKRKEIQKSLNEWIRKYISIEMNLSLNFVDFQQSVNNGIKNRKMIHLRGQSRSLGQFCLIVIRRMYLLLI